MDGDIQHNNSMPLYPFLFVKWRTDSIVYILTNFKFKDWVLVAIHYAMISRQRLIYFLVGTLIAGFYSANILLGNHEREKRFNFEIKDDFIDHQISTTRNYPYEGVLSLIALGGMQYEAEHHLFPQIPFYNLELTKNIIREELNSNNK